MREKIIRFYNSFEKRDAEDMIELYHEDIVFKDPVFGELKGEHAKNMWRMLCANAQDLHIDYSDLKTDDNRGEVQWEAHYTFSKTGRKVHNIIDAKFKFKDGKIISHVDSFNLRKWAKQALGSKNTFFAGTWIFRKKLNEQTQELLRKFEANLKNK